MIHLAQMYIVLLCYGYKSFYPVTMLIWKLETGETVFSAGRMSGKYAYVVESWARRLSTSQWRGDCSPHIHRFFLVTGDYLELVRLVFILKNTGFWRSFPKHSAGTMEPGDAIELLRELVERAKVKRALSPDLVEAG